MQSLIAGSKCRDRENAELAAHQTRLSLPSLICTCEDSWLLVLLRHLNRVLLHHGETVVKRYQTKFQELKNQSE